MIMKTKLLALALALAFVMPLTVSADEDTTGDTVVSETEDATVSDAAAEIRAEIQELKAYLADLREQVKNGELTQDEAKEAWKAAVAELREKKDALFQGLMDHAKEKYDRLAENNPELAEAIKNRFEGFKAARQERHERFKELRESLGEGEMTRDEFRSGVREAGQEFRAKRAENAEEFHGFIEGRREQLREKRGDAPVQDTEDDSDGSTDDSEDTEE